MKNLGIRFSVLLFLTTPSFGQTERFQDNVTVTLIEVPVTVTDRSGEPVTDLSRDDFSIYDDGVEQEIEYFESVDVAEALAKRERGLPSPSIPRLHVLLLFDLSNSTPVALTRARNAAREFVAEGIAGDALVAVATTSHEGGTRLLTSFTSNQDLVKLAIDSLGGHGVFRVADPLLLSATAESGGAGGQGISGAGDEMIEIARVFDRMNAQLRNESNRARMEAQLEGLAGLARTIGGLRGRKQVVLLSEGFDAEMVQGRDLTADQSESIARGEVWSVDSNQRFGFSAAGEMLQKMGEIFKRSDVVLHAVDVGGIRTGVSARDGFKRSNNDSLNLLTSPTGGQVFKNTNHLARSLESVTSRQRHIYMMAFRPTSSTGDFHEIEVKLRDRRGLTIGHREGYFEPSTNAEVRLTIAAVLMNDIPHDDVKISLMATSFSISGSKALVPVIIEVSGEDLLEVADGSNLTAEIYTYAFDEDDSVVDFRQQRVGLDLGKVESRLARRGLKYYGVLRLPPGLFAVKTVVTLDQGRVAGFARTDVSVSLSGTHLSAPLFFDDSDEWIRVRSQDRTPEESLYPYVYESESFIPEARARLEEGGNRFVVFSRGIDWNRAEVRTVLSGVEGEANGVTVRLVPGQDLPEPSRLGAVLLELSVTGSLRGPGLLEIAVKDQTGQLKIIEHPVLVEAVETVKTAAQREEGESQ